MHTHIHIHTCTPYHFESDQPNSSIALTMNGIVKRYIKMMARQHFFLSLIQERRGLRYSPITDIKNSRAVTRPSLVSAKHKTNWFPKKANRQDWNPCDKNKVFN